MYKLLLCWRYLRTRYIALASIISVMLGVATMIVVNAVMAGFTTEMENRLHGILSDLTLESRSLEGMYDAERHMAAIRRVAGEQIAGMTPTVVVPAMLSFRYGGEWITRQVDLIGIDEKTHAEVSDFARFLQHAENRRRLSFALRESGYDTRDHQAGPEAPPRPQMALAGWDYRRRWAEAQALQRRLREAAEADWPGSRGAPDLRFQARPELNPVRPATSDQSALGRLPRRLEPPAAEAEAVGQPPAPLPQGSEALPAGRPSCWSMAGTALPDASFAHGSVPGRGINTDTHSSMPDPGINADAHPSQPDPGINANGRSSAPGLGNDAEAPAAPRAIELSAANSDPPPATELFGASAPTPPQTDPFAAGTDTPPGIDPFAAREAEVAEVFDPARQQHTGLVGGIGLFSFRTPEGEDRFLALPGDDVKLTFPTAGTPPTAVSDDFTIVDLYESKMSEYDASFVFVPLQKLQQLRGMIDPQTGVGRVNAIQIKLKPGTDAEQVRDRLRAAFPAELYGVYTWRDKQGPLLAAVRMETAILNVLLFLIIAVAGFGILAIFYMIVVEKTRDIGILKSLGAPSRGVMGIFLGYGLSLGVVGSGVGLGLGLLLVRYINEVADFLGWLTGRPLFDPAIYYFYRIPTILQGRTIVWILIGALAIAVAASVAPACRAARLDPVEALRYE